jgi:hypothetical protein
MVYLLNDDEVKSELGEAFSSVMINPTVTWAKFVLTDDKTNANGERIPHQEFTNVIRSGLHMPVKMAIGEISPGHPGTKPLGTITHLKEVQTDDGASAIVAIAALWGQERPADVQFIKDRFAAQLPVDVSWEILYEDATFNAETSSMDLQGTVLRAATIVGNPAYEGRTQFLSIAAKKKSEATIDDQSDTTDAGNYSEDKLDKIEELQAKVAELEPKLTEVREQLTAKETSLAERETELEQLKGNLSALEAEIEPLREFKSSVDAEIAKAEKIAAVKTKFQEAGLKKDDEYFDTNSEKLLKMDEDTLSFVIQEMASNLTTEEHISSDASTHTKIPNLLNTDEEVDYKNPKVLGQLLRTQGKK